MVKIVKSTIQALAKVTKGLSSRGVMRALVKSVAIQLVISLSLFADSNPLDGFNVTVKDLVVAGKTVRISPFKGIGVVTVNLCFKNAGDKLSPKQKEALVALLCRAMGESTQSKAREQMQTYAREHNVHVSFGSSDDNFTITGKCPSDKLSELFHLIKDILFHSQFHDSDLIRFKNEMAAGMLQAMQSPDTQLDQLMKKVIFKSHPYGTLNKTYLQSLKNISVDDLKSYMKKCFTQENIIISACGDIDEETLASHITDVVTALPKTFKDALPENVQVVGPYQEHTQAFPVPQTLIHFLHAGINAHHPDFFALQIAMGCLSNPNIGVLWKKIRVEKGLTYNISAGFAIQNHYNSFNISTSTQSENVEKTISSIKEVIADVCENGFSAELVEIVKKSFLGNYKRSFASTSHITTRLTNYQLDGRSVDFHNTLIEKISNLTTDEVNEAFKRFMKPDQFVVFMVGK